MIDTISLKKEMINLDNNNKTFIPLTMDKMFKGIFKDDQDLLKDFILSQIDLKIDIYNISILDSELVKSKYKEYQKTVDILVLINFNIYVNIEINRDYFKNVANRNFMFGNKVQILMMKSGNNLKDFKEKKFYQINLNAREKFNDIKIKGFDKVVLYGLISHKTYNKNINFLVKYLDYYRYLYYNVDKKLTEKELWLVLFTSTSYKELYDIASKLLDKEKLEKFIRRVIYMNNQKILEDWEEDYLDAMIENDTRNNLIEEYQSKLDEKDKQLENQNKKLENQNKQLKKSIINMFKEGFDNNVISRITGKSITEIEKILMYQ